MDWGWLVVIAVAIVGAYLLWSLGMCVYSIKMQICLVGCFDRMRTFWLEFRLVWEGSQAGGANPTKSRGVQQSRRAWWALGSGRKEVSQYMLRSVHVVELLLSLYLITF